MLKKVAKRANSNEEPNCHGYIPGRSVDNPNTIIVFGKYLGPINCQWFSVSDEEANMTLSNLSLFPPEQ